MGFFTMMSIEDGGKRLADIVHQTTAIEQACHVANLVVVLEECICVVEPELVTYSHSVHLGPHLPLPYHLVRHRLMLRSESTEPR